MFYTGVYQRRNGKSLKSLHHGCAQAAEDGGGQVLGEEVSELIGGGDALKGDRASGDGLAAPVIANINVLGTTRGVRIRRRSYY